MSTRTRLLLAAISALAILAPATAASGRSVEPGGGHDVSAPTVPAPRLGAWQPQLGNPLAPRLGVQGLPPSPLSTGMPGAAFGFGSALVGSAPVGNGPSTLAVDAATRTIYVANGYNDDGPQAVGNTVSVVDARRCQAQDVLRCKGPWPTITVGNLPSGIAIDTQTDTVYVSNVGDRTVSVFNGATCNARVTSGCGQTPATVPVGVGPLGIFADPANHTVYISNFGDIALGGPADSTTVSMLDSATCNATHLGACPTTEPPTVNVGVTPDDVDVNQSTHTVYVAILGGLSVFDANTCNATVQSGCGAIGTLTGDPNGVNSAKVDPANSTLYTANYDSTISAFDLRHCNASDLAGCATQTPGTVTPFPAPFYEHNLWVAVDAPLHSAVFLSS